LIRTPQHLPPSNRLCESTNHGFPPRQTMPRCRCGVCRSVDRIVVQMRRHVVGLVIASQRFCCDTPCCSAAPYVATENRLIHTPQPSPPTNRLCEST